MSVNKTIRLALIGLCTLSIAVGVSAQSQNYLPLTSKDLGAPIRLKPLGRMKQSIRLQSSAGPSGGRYRVITDKSLVVLEGADREGKAWSVDLNTLGCDSPRIYESDLDKNGIVDAVLLKNTCGNGLAPSSHILTVTFDSTGRPVPFEAEGYFLEQAGGVDALVDLNRDGIADLIFMNFDDGYWITNVYTLDGARWTRIKGPFANREFPLFTRFTDLPNKVPEKPAATRSPYAPDLSNKTSVVDGRLIGHFRPDEYNLRLTIRTVDGNPMVCTPNYWYDSARLVVDLPSGRRVRRLSYEDRGRTDPLLDEVVKGAYPVKLYGERYRDKCAPELLWASGS